MKIKQNKTETFKEFIYVNQNDTYSIDAINFAISWAKTLETLLDVYNENVVFSLSNIMFVRDNMSTLTEVTRTTKDIATHILITFWKYGDQLKNIIRRKENV